MPDPDPPDLYPAEMRAAVLLVTLALLVLTAQVVLRRIRPPGLPRTQPVRLDVNRAPMDELIVLPGVGHKTALDIVAGRPYGSLADLERVIGARKLGRVRPFVVVAPVDSSLPDLLGDRERDDTAR